MERELKREQDICIEREADREIERESHTEAKFRKKKYILYIIRIRNIRIIYNYRSGNEYFFLAVTCI